MALLCYIISLLLLDGSALMEHYLAPHDMTAKCTYMVLFWLFATASLGSMSKFVTWMKSSLDWSGKSDLFMINYIFLFMYLCSHSIETSARWQKVQ